MAAGTLLARYEAGEFEAVWREIRSHPNVDGLLRDEVIEVAEATMRRVATNADMLAHRLRARGWRALFAEDHDLRTKPSSKDEPILARIVEISGKPLPPSLLVFWKIVGGINFVWDYRASGVAPNIGIDLPMDEMDPLYVDAPGAMTYLFEEWEDERSEGTVEGEFRIDLSPDYLHKANISGGMPYAIVVPFLGADPIFADERHKLPFVDYLRLAFKWAGFPGLESHSQRADVQRFVAEFGSGLLPF
ncbi:MAG: hypothetical protein ACKVP3_11640 [Hyphomicrobiaceae bacterium]